VRRQNGLHDNGTFSMTTAGFGPQALTWKDKSDNKVNRSGEVYNTFSILCVSVILHIALAFKGLFIRWRRTKASRTLLVVHFRKQ
jgi:hypothetical protein